MARPKVGEEFEQLIFNKMLRLEEKRTELTKLIESELAAEGDAIRSEQHHASKYPMRSCHSYGSEKHADKARAAAKQLATVEVEIQKLTLVKEYVPLVVLGGITVEQVYRQVDLEIAALAR